MGTVRDPQFWKRFSLAVHQDEEAQAQAAAAGPEKIKHSESWLAEQQRKRSKRTKMCWGFWLMFAVLVAGIVVAILLLKGRGII